MAGNHKFLILQGEILIVSFFTPKLIIYSYYHQKECQSIKKEVILKILIPSNSGGLNV
jgi:hypothetical protein